MIRIIDIPKYVYDIAIQEGAIIDADKKTVVDAIKNSISLDDLYGEILDCPGGESYIVIDGKKYNSDIGYALEGMEIFLDVVKRRFYPVKMTPDKAIDILTADDVSHYSIEEICRARAMAISAIKKISEEKK